MISTFLSIVFGFGMVMTKDYMKKMNDIRQGKNYTNEDALNAINRGSVDNPKTTKHTFVTTF